LADKATAGEKACSAVVGYWAWFAFIPALGWADELPVSALDVPALRTPVMRTSSMLSTTWIS